MHHKDVLIPHSAYSGNPVYLLPLAAVLQNAGGVINGPVVFADRQVRALVLVNLNHEVVVLQLQLLKCATGQKGRVSFQLHRPI